MSFNLVLSSHGSYPVYRVNLHDLVSLKFFVFCEAFVKFRSFCQPTIASAKKKNDNFVWLIW
jgi:hypothetical protein